MMLIDSHCHLDCPEFEADLPEVVARAREAGIGGMITIGTHLSLFPQVAAIAARYADQNIWCSVGMHPEYVGEEDEALLTPANLIRLAAHPRVVGIGECGLDYYYDNSPRDVQRERFRMQIDVAKTLDLPLIVHTRDAEEDTLLLLKEAGPTLRGVLHCFSSSRALAEAALELGFYISLSGILTFNKSDDLRETARHIPLDRLLVETDAPFLAPVPLRGKRNEPAHTVHTAKRLAELKGVSLEALAEATTANFFSLFTRARLA